MMPAGHIRALLPASGSHLPKLRAGTAPPSAGRMGADRFQGIQDNFQHCFGFLKHLVVPESEHAISLRFDPTVTALIVAMALLMLCAIELHYEPRFETREICDMAADRRLAAP